MDNLGSTSSCSNSDRAALDCNMDTWTVHVCPTTGGQYDMKVCPQDCVDSFKKNIAKRLKISKEKISLLHKDRYSFNMFIFGID